MIQCAVDAAFAKKHMQKVKELAIQQAAECEEHNVQARLSSSTDSGLSFGGFSPDEMDGRCHVVSLAAFI